MRVALALALVLAAGCATPGQARRDADEDACRTGVPAACASRGLRALSGEGVPRDERDAAAWLMAACERGLAQSCADLGALYAAGRGVRKDDGRACDLGLADACARAGRPASIVVRTPNVTLGPEPESERPLPPDPADVQRALDYAEFFVAAGDHQPLGLTRQALEADPPAPWRDVQLVRPLVDLRSSEVARCLPVYRYPSGFESSLATINFALDRDGRTSRASVKALEPSEPVQRCVADVLARWEFPRPVTGGRMWFPVKGIGPVKDAPPHPEPAVRPTARWRRPSEKEPDCIARHVRVPPRFEGVSTRTIAKYSVKADGRATNFLLFEPIPIPLARSLREAVYSCEFVPAADEEGNPVTMWIIQPFRFAGQ